MRNLLKCIVAMEAAMFAEAAVDMAIDDLCPWANHLACLTL